MPLHDRRKDGVVNFGFRHDNYVRFNVITYGCIPAGLPLALLTFNVKIRNIPLGSDIVLFLEFRIETTEVPDDLPSVLTDGLGELHHQHHTREQICISIESISRFQSLGSPPQEDPGSIWRSVELNSLSHRP